jgi:hypothetical protein
LIFFEILVFRKIEVSETSLSPTVHMTLIGHGSMGVFTEQ